MISHCKDFAMRMASDVFPMAVGPTTAIRNFWFEPISGVKSGAAMEAKIGVVLMVVDAAIRAGLRVGFSFVFL